MALTWNVTRVAEYEDVTTLCYEDGAPVLSDIGEKRWHPVTEALVWMSMACGYNNITDANSSAIFARIAAWEAINGPNVTLGGEPYNITLNDVRRHMGMTTNAARKTPKEFLDLLTDTVRYVKPGPVEQYRVPRVEE
jgi:hypothetical protein